jgi:hypothetical protein
MKSDCVVECVKITQCAAANDNWIEIFEFEISWGRCQNLWIKLDGLFKAQARRLKKCLLISAHAQLKVVLV